MQGLRACFFVVGTGMADVGFMEPFPAPAKQWRAGQFFCCKVVRYAVRRVKYPFLPSMPEALLRGHRPRDLNSCKKANIFAPIDVNI